MVISEITNKELPQILKINEASVNFLSPLNSDLLVELIKQGKYHKIVILDGKVVAFILTLEKDANYLSPNYLWFKNKYNTFLYVDRIVVAKEYRRQGIGDFIYSQVIEYASKNGFEYLTCEIDIEPPNPGSIKFHDKHKFVEVGKQWIYGGIKQVSLRTRTLAL